jgi:hypothetical protein
MNKIEKLIAELCPNGVEFKELGECCKGQKERLLQRKKCLKLIKKALR